MILWDSDLPQSRHMEPGLSQKHRLAAVIS